VFCFHLSQTVLSQDLIDSRKLEILQLIKEADKNIYDDPTESLKSAEQSLQLSKEVKDDSLIAVSLNRMGNAYWSLGNQMEAIGHLQESLQISETKELEELTAKNLGNIGNVYSAAGFNLDAINYYKLELQIQKRLKQKRRLFAIYNNIGSAFFTLNEFDSTHHYLQIATNYLDESFIELSPILFSNMAETFLLQNELGKADSLLKLTFKSAEKYGSQRSLVIANQLKAELERKRGKYRNAFQYAKKSVDMAYASKVKELIYISNRTLSNCYGDLGQFEEAYQKRLIYEVYKDSVQNANVKNELELLSYYQRLFRVRVLEEKNLVSSELAEQRKWIIFGLIGILLFVGILLIIIIRTRLKLEHQKKELESLNNFKTKVFGIVSHDLRSPIQSFVHVVDLLNRKMITKEEIEPLIPELREKSQSLLGLLSNLLRWAGDQMEKTAVDKEYFSLVTILNELELEFEEKLKLKEIAFIYDSELRLRIYSNREIVKIVLRNLLLNAIKFSHKQSKIFIKGLIENKMNVISVEDHGIGMKQETVEQLFSSELTSTLGTSGEQGTGLGLALCGDLVERLGGTIEIDSAVNRGSAFHILLPEK
jgi:two-component system, sensor histidine kinase and response regulator